MQILPKLWITLWKNRWANCELAANKLVEKGNFGQNKGFWLWNTGFGCGVKSKNCENFRYYGGKALQINKLYKAEISTTST